MIVDNRGEGMSDTRTTPILTTTGTENPPPPTGLSSLPERPARARRGELKTEIAVQRHELMRENMRLRAELADITLDRDGCRRWSEEIAATLDARNAEIATLRAAQCPWCRWRARRAGA